MIPGELSVHADEERAHSKNGAEANPQISTGTENVTELWNPSPI